MVSFLWYGYNTTSQGTPKRLDVFMYTLIRPACAFNRWDRFESDSEICICVVRILSLRMETVFLILRGFKCQFLPGCLIDEF